MENSNDSTDYLSVEVSGDGGQTWNILQRYSEAHDDESWHKASFPLADYIDSESFKTRFVIDNDSREEIEIDYITISGTSIDPTSPVLQIVSPTSGQIITGNTIQVSGTASDPESGISTVQIKIDDGAFSVATGTTSWSMSIGSLPSGSHTITARATNGEGLQANTSIVITVATIPDAPTNLTSNIISPNEINLIWFAPNNDGGSSITGYLIERDLNNTGFTTLVSNTNSATTTYSDGTLSSGDTASYVVSAINDIGTSTQSNESTVTTPDTIPPEIILPNDITAEATGQQTSVNIGIATATDNYDPNPVITNNATSSYPVGTTNILWTVTDSTNNYSTGIQTIIIQDTTPPTLVIPANLTLEATAINTPVSSEQIGVATATDLVDSNPTVTNNATATFLLGTTNVIWTVTDGYSNSASAIQTITIQDTQPPVVTDPVDIAIEATGPLTVLTKTILGTATATDNIDADLTITNNVTSTTGYPLGIYTIKYSSTDDSGNIGNATQLITIQDTTAPTVTAPDDYSIEISGTMIPLTEADFGSATATDLVDDDVTVNLLAPTTFSVGSVLITWTATDYSGNISTAVHQTITVTQEPLQKTSIFFDQFNSTLDGWTHKQKPNTVANTRYCQTQNTGAYSLNHSFNHGGSAYTNYANICWFGSAGGVTSFTPTSSGSLEITLDYRSLSANTYNSVGHTNNMRLVITDSADNVLKSEILFGGERSNAIQDIGWNKKTITVDNISPTDCPCEMYVYLADSWISQWQQQNYFDNVNMTLTSSSGATGTSHIPMPENGLSIDQYFDNLFTNGTKVFVTDHKEYSNSIILDWEDFGDDANEYKVVIAPKSDTQDKTRYITSDTDFQIINLTPDIEYQVSVGEKGYDDTQTILDIATLSDGTAAVIFNSEIFASGFLQTHSDKINLHWTDFNKIGENRYRIERAVVGDDDNYDDISFESTDLRPKFQKSIQDTIRPDWLGKTIHYKVFERLDGQKLYSENIASISIPSQLQTPQNFVGSSSYVEGIGNMATLSWEHSSLFRNYLVEQYVDGEWIRIDKIADNSISILISGETTFRVMAHINGVTSASAEITVK